MAIEPKFNRNDVIKKLLADRSKIEQSIINRLKYVGEQFIRDARSVDTYKDQTGNLRSSIGYVILKEGQQVLDAFPGEKPSGTAAGIKAANDAAQKFPTGIVLIVVAGMDYAAAVEAKGKDVLTTSSYAAISGLIETMGKLRDKLQ